MRKGNRFTLAVRCAWGVALGASMGIGATAQAAEASAFEQVIAPILQARCAECHGEGKQKGKFALHTWDALAKGGDSGAAFVAGNADESLLVQRLKLPKDEDEHMPPSDQPQPAAEEIELITRWIASGASRTAPVAALGLNPALTKAAAELPAKLAAASANRVPEHGDGVWEYDPAAVEKARAPLAKAVAELQRRFPGALSYESRTSATLLFTAVGVGATFGDAELAKLADIGTELVSLDISGTAVSDSEVVAAALTRFPKLRVFRASGAPVGDRVAQAIAQLPALEVAALHETKVTEASVAAFARSAKLRALRVSGTAAERAAVIAKLPVVPSAAELVPPPVPAVSDGPKTAP